MISGGPMIAKEIVLVLWRPLAFILVFGLFVWVRRPRGAQRGGTLGARPRSSVDRAAVSYTAEKRRDHGGQAFLGAPESRPARSLPCISSTNRQNSMEECGVSPARRADLGDFVQVSSRRGPTADDAARVDSRR